MSVSQTVLVKNQSVGFSRQNQFESKNLTKKNLTKKKSRDNPESASILAHVTLIAMKVAMGVTIPSARNALILKKIPISKNVKTLLTLNWKYAWPTVLVMRLALLLAPMNTLKN